jgi:hypothetical protein
MCGRYIYYFEVIVALSFKNGLDIDFVRFTVITFIDAFVYDCEYTFDMSSF